MLWKLRNSSFQVSGRAFWNALPAVLGLLAVGALLAIVIVVHLILVIWRSLVITAHRSWLRRYRR